MTDLKRLRELAEAYQVHSSNPRVHRDFVVEVGPQLLSLLDHIDAQAREIEECKRLRDLEQRIKSIKPGSIDEYFATEERCALAEQTVASQAEVIEKLVEALKPFAAVVETMRERLGPLTEHLPERGIVETTFGKCRAAAAALALAVKPQTQEPK